MKSPVHHRQGTLDGACGLYSVLMTLLIHRVTHPDELSLLDEADGRTRLGKLRAAMSEQPALVQDGMHLAELESMIATSFGGLLDLEYCDARGAKLLPFIRRSLADDRPVIIGLEASGWAHAVVLVGMELDDDASNGKPTRLLAVDPSADVPPPTASAWNLMINSFATTGGRYPYTCWYGPEGESVQLAGGLATWRKDGQ